MVTPEITTPLNAGRAKLAPQMPEKFLAPYLFLPDGTATAPPKNAEPPGVKKK